MKYFSTYLSKKYLGRIINRFSSSPEAFWSYAVICFTLIALMALLLDVGTFISFAQDTSSASSAQQVNLEHLNTDALNLILKNIASRDAEFSGSSSPSSIPDIFRTR